MIGLWGAWPECPLGPPLPWRPLPNAPVPVHNGIYLPKTTKFVGYRRLNIVEPGDYIYTTLARDILLVIAGGSRREFRSVGLPKTQSSLFAPPPPHTRLIGVSLFTALDVLFTDMNISNILWHCQIVY